MSIAIEPKSGRAVAAYGSIEAGGIGPYNTVYVSLFSTVTKSWITGSDLTVFAKDATGTNFYVFPARGAAETCDAFSPSLAVTKAGRIFTDPRTRSAGAFPAVLELGLVVVE